MVSLLFPFYHQHQHQLHSHSSFNRLINATNLSKPSNYHFLTSKPKQSSHRPPHQIHPHKLSQCLASISQALPSPTPTRRPPLAPHPAPPRWPQNLPAVAPLRTTGPPQAPTSASSLPSAPLLHPAPEVSRLPSRQERRRASGAGSRASLTRAPRTTGQEPHRMPSLVLWHHRLLPASKRLEGMR